MDALLKQDVGERQRRLTENAGQIQAEDNSAKQTQSHPAKPVAIPRSAPCPCKSGEKYKRCCGKNAPPVLSSPAA
jgi:hypothetical protein